MAEEWFRCYTDIQAKQAEMKELKKTFSSLSETLQNLLEATDTDCIMLSNGKKIVNKEIIIKSIQPRW